MILDTTKLMEDLRAIIASATTGQLEVLKTLQAVMQERINELTEEIAADGDSGEESTSQEG